MGFATGSVVLKVNFNGEFKRISVPRDGLNFSEVMEHVTLLFPMLAHRHFVVRYQDEEGDLISFSTNDELTYAIEDTNVLRLHVTLDQDEPEMPVVLESPKVRVAAPEVIENMVKLAFDSANVDIPDQGHLLLMLNGKEIRQWEQPSGTVMLDQLPTGQHEFRVAFVSSENQVGPEAYVSFKLEPVQPPVPALEPKITIEPAVQPPDMLRFTINIADFDLQHGRALVKLNDKPAAVLKQPESCIVLRDLEQGSRHCLQVQLVDGAGDILAHGAQAEFVMPVLSAPEPEIVIDAPAATEDGSSVLLKFAVRNYDFGNGPALVLINGKPAAVVGLEECTLCLTDMAAGTHQVEVHIANSVSATSEFTVVKPRMPNIVLLQPAAYGSDKLLLRFELDAPLPAGMVARTSLNGKLAAEFQRQDGCVVVDKPLQGTHIFKVEIPGTDRAEQITVVLA